MRAAKTDTYGLYSAGMTTSSINRISRSGVSGSYTYAVNPGSGNKPITYVSWFDAARFCNWLRNGQQTGAGAALTAETGASTLSGATSGIITKNVGATVWIPSESEWYKAAYYEPNKGSCHKYLETWSRSPPGLARVARKKLFSFLRPLAELLRTLAG